MLSGRGPLAAAATGQAVYSYGAHTAHAQQAAWHPVPAVLLATAPTTGYTGYQPQVRAGWRAPDGARRTGTAPAQPGERAGGTVMVWADAAGQLTGAPLLAQHVRGRAVLAAVLAPVVLDQMLRLTGELVHYLLGRWRLAARDAEWRATGPQWSRQR